MRIDAILPAGGRVHGHFAAQLGSDVKALIPLGGQAILGRTVDALRGTGSVERIVVIGPDEVSAHESSKTADAVLPEGGDSGPANIIRGLQWLHDSDGKHADRVLVVTTDLPFLTAEAISAFVDACDPDCDICAPLVSREAFEAKYPGSENQYVALADGHWTMGCAFLMNPETILRNQSLIEQAFAARKSQLAMARLLGLGFIIRFITRRLTVHDIESRCHRILGCKSSGIYNSAPELAYDIDEAAHYEYARNVIGS